MSLPDDVVRSPKAPALVQKLVTLTEIEYIGLVQQAHYWHSAHQHAVEREQLLRTELEQAHARIRQLEHCLFAHKSEQHKPRDKQAQASARAKGQRRGQRWGTKGHGRRREQELPAHHEWIGIEPAQCPCCGLPLRPFPGTEEAQVIEIEVKAYRRVIHRKRYQPSCQCGVLPGIVTAPAPHRLINKGKFGISVWVLVLLDKFVYARPSQRLLQQLGDDGMHMAAGSLAQGLQEIAPLLQPLDIAIQQRVRHEQHWHANETRWAVFTEIQGKVGYRWYLWVFHSATAVHYVLQPSRAAEVVEHEFGDIEGGILSCDRYSGYKKFARLHEGVVLAYCWAHQRRDFLDLANAYPHCEAWALDWVQAIGRLYHLNASRLQAALGTPEREQAQAALQEAVEQMAQRRDVQLISPVLHPQAVKVLHSMKEHWSGLTVFVQAPWVEMDNNIAERDIRIAVVGRKNFYGSGAPWSAQLAATMFSLAATLRLWKINPRTWLQTYLTACAASENRAPETLDAFLPWTMDADQLAMLRKACPAGFDTS